MPTAVEPDAVPFRTRLAKWEAWGSLVVGVACLGAYSVGPSYHAHPDEAAAMIGFSVAAAVGVGLSVGGLRFAAFPAKGAAYGGLLFSVAVALDLFNTLLNG